jgi:hypothetical protein
MEKSEIRKWSQTVLIGLALTGTGAAANAASAKTPDITAPVQEPARRDPTGTGVEPTVPDTGNSKTAPGVVPKEIIQKDGDLPLSGSNTTPRDMADVNGVVQSVDRTDPNNTRVRIKDESGNIRDVRINQRTSIMINGKKTPLARVKAGNKVTVQSEPAIQKENN